MVYLQILGHFFVGDKEGRGIEVQVTASNKMGEEFKRSRFLGTVIFEWLLYN